jgi:hypothetical protein
MQQGSGFKSVNNGHAVRQHIMSGAHGGSSRSAGNLTAGSSKPASRSETPVPLPRIPVRLGTLPAGRKSDYEETEVIHDEKPQSAGQSGNASPAAVVVSDTAGKVSNRLRVKQTSVPLPQSIPQRQAAAAAQRSAQPSPQPTTKTISATTPQTPGSSKRGRPKGWRPGMSYAEVRGTSPTRPRAARKIKPADGGGGTIVVKRRGRPPKQPSPPPVEVYLQQNVAFVAFLCEWRGCKAELHNLETLRRHMRIVHLRPLEKADTGRRCCWGKCGLAGDDDDEGREFAGAKELEAHVEREHLVPFSWHVGDGPRNSGWFGKRKGRDEEDDVPSWLKDADGNQVTPSIKDQAIEDYATWRQNRRKLKRLLIERDRNPPSESEDNSPEAE